MTTSLSKTSQNSLVPSEVPELMASAIKAQNELSETSPEISPDKLRIAALAISNLEHGYHAMVPMYCKGTSCPMEKSCALIQAGFNYMLNKPCPLEDHLIRTWGSKLCKDLNVNLSNSVETNLVAELAKISIYRLRISQRLAVEDFIKQQIVAVDDDGVPQYRDELHPAIAWEDSLSKRELKLLDALLATRKSIAEVGGGSSIDPSSNAANIQSIIDKAQKNLNKQAEDLRAQNAKQV